MELVAALLAGTVAAATPLIFAALGELVTEKAGVLNLGVEGMMLMGAIAAFAGATTSQSLALGLVCGMLGGVVMAFLFGALALFLLTNQVATGLALTIFGTGLSAFVGQAYVSQTLKGLQPLPLPWLSELPILGPALFDQNVLVYISLLAFAAIYGFLYRTKAGLVLRAVGESPESAHAIGYHVVRIRFLATLFGGAMCGLAGAYLAVAYTPMWVEQLTAGRGWIALALVVFATWRPERVLGGAYLFGGVTILQLHAQAFGLAVPSQFLSALPYVATIVVLVLISQDVQKIRVNAPMSLGKPFHAGD